MAHIGVLLERLCSDYESPLLNPGPRVLGFGFGC